MTTLSRIKTESISKLKYRMKKGKVWQKKRGEIFLSSFCI
jgi:hypothetical protein